MTATALLRRIVDRSLWEIHEWRRPSRTAFLQDELDEAAVNGIAWRAGERVLDIGCARGAYLDALRRRGAAPIGIDISFAMLKEARRAGHVALGASGSALPFVDGSFDAILCHRTMFLFENPARIIAEFSRVLRPGGRLVFSASNTTSPYARIQEWAIRRSRDRNWMFGNRWSVEQWRRAFERSGFVSRAVFSCNLVWPLIYRICDWWILPNEWMRRYSRWIRRVSGVPLRTNRPLSVAMDYVVEMEVAPAAQGLKSGCRYFSRTA